MSGIVALPAPLQIPLGAIPPGGAVPLPFTVPTDEAVFGIPLVFQPLVARAGSSKLRWGNVATAFIVAP